MLKRLLFAVLMAVAFACQAAVYSLPWGPRPQFMDSNGAPMSGGTLQFYAAGSTTPQNTYTDSTGAVANSNPITLNVRGETPNEVWLLGGLGYKVLLKDSFGSTVWTIDNLRGINDTTVTIDQWISGPTPTYVSATSFTLAGDQTLTFTAGRRIKTTNSGGTIYSTITSSAFSSVTTLTVINDSGTLDSGLSAVSYALLSYTNNSAPNGGVFMPGMLMPYAGTSAPTGWIYCDGTAYSRVAYAALFSAIGTTYGTGDGSTTFNVPDFRGRVPLGDGTGTVAETVTSQAASGNAIPVASNNDKWITGASVALTGVSGYTGLSNGSYFIVRASASTVKFATTLANAQNGTVVTVTGTGSATITGTLTARTRGDVGGEEAHAMSSTEQLAHIHGITDPGHVHQEQMDTAGSGFGGSNQFNATPGSIAVNTLSATTGITINSTGGNAAMNNMQPYGVIKYIIKY